MVSPVWAQEGGAGETSVVEAFDGELAEEEFLDMFGDDRGTTVYGIREHPVFQEPDGSGGDRRDGDQHAEVQSGERVG
jgi:hypothetical protein